MELVERVDADDRAAADGLRRLRLVAADERRVRRVVEQAAELAVVEERLRVALDGVLKALADADVRQSIARIAANPFLPDKSSVRGFVYDVKTGKLREGRFRTDRVAPSVPALVAREWLRL